jgi:hypothetical protein
MIDIRLDKGLEGAEFIIAEGGIHITEKFGLQDARVLEMLQYVTLRPPDSDR